MGVEVYKKAGPQEGNGNELDARGRKVDPNYLQIGRHKKEIRYE